MKRLIVYSCVLFSTALLFAAPPEIPSGGRGPGSGGGQQPGGGGNQPDQPGGGGSFTYDTFLTDSTITNGCIAYGDLVTGYVDGQATIVLPANVTRIADGAFAGNSSVTVIDATAASGLTELPEAFATGCGALVEVALPVNASIVGATACAMDSALATFTGEGVTTVGDYAFFGCSSLVLPASTTYETIGEDALSGVSYVTDDGDVYISEVAPLVTWIKAKGGSSLASLPASCDTTTLKTWLTNDVANLEAYLYAEEFASDEDFTVLTVSGTNFLFAAQDRSTLSVAHAVLQVSTDLTNWENVPEGDIEGGVYSLSAASNGFARVIYSLPW